METGRSLPRWQQPVTQPCLQAHTFTPVSTVSALTTWSPDGICPSDRIPCARLLHRKMRFRWQPRSSRAKTWLSEWCTGATQTDTLSRKKQVRGCGEFSRRRATNHARPVGLPDADNPVYRTAATSGWLLHQRLAGAICDASKSLHDILTGSNSSCNSCVKFTAGFNKLRHCITIRTETIHPTALRPKSGLGLICHYIVLSSAASFQLRQPNIFPSLPGLSKWSHSSKLSFKHVLRNSCVSHPFDMSHPLKPFQFDACYKVRFTIWFTQFLAVANPSLSKRSINVVYSTCQVHGRFDN
jgi:hypothetical protein